MKLYSVEMEVRRYSNRITFGGEQKLERATYILGICVWRTVLDTEHYPAWAEIQKGALGYSEWESKFTEYMK